MLGQETPSKTRVFDQKRDPQNVTTGWVVCVAGLLMKSPTLSRVEGAAYEKQLIFQLYGLQGSSRETESLVSKVG